MERNVKYGVYTYNGAEERFTFYTNLRAIDKLNFVNRVINVIVGDNYYPSIRDMIFDFNIIDVMTDIDVSHIKNENDAISAIEDFLDETHIVEIVKLNVPELIEELNNAVDLAIEYRTGIHKDTIADSLGRLLNTIEKKVAGIDTESMMNMAQSLSDISGELTVDKFIKAYANSDLFKEKYAQMMVDREKHNEKIDEVGTVTKSVRKNTKKIADVK